MKFNPVLPTVDLRHLLRQFLIVLEGNIITEDTNCCIFISKQDTFRLI